MWPTDQLTDKAGCRVPYHATKNQFNWVIFTGFMVISSFAKKLILHKFSLLNIAVKPLKIIRADFFSQNYIEFFAWSNMRFYLCSIIETQIITKHHSTITTDNLGTKVGTKKKAWHCLCMAIFVQKSVVLEQIFQLLTDNQRILLDFLYFANGCRKRSF